MSLATETVTAERHNSTEQSDNPLPTINTICGVYEDDRADPFARKPCLHPGSIKAHLKAVRAAVGHFTAQEFFDRTEQIQRDAEAVWRAAGTSQGTIHKRWSMLASAFKCCVRKKIIKRDQEPFIYTGPAGAPRERYLDRVTEWPRLKEALDDMDTPDHVRLFIHLQLRGAQRCGAALSLKWEMIDLPNGIIHFKRTAETKARNKNRVDIPMGAGLRDLLERAYKRRRTDYVIEYQGERVRNISTAFKSVMKRAGIEGVRIHDLRRTAATWAFQDGVPLSKVAALLGDDEQIVRRHYAHVCVDYIDTAVNALDELMA